MQTLLHAIPVSIPHWFDQAYIEAIHDTSGYEFQFHTGSIKPPDGGLQRVDGQRFQFHTGSIKPWLLPVPRLRFSYVSIPHWFDQAEGWENRSRD
jgi:hypothetical protein